ncbi:TetR/AcrR family transcriptional regulator [Desulfosporosinus sp. FKB]|uniref:TetR/AcrR family transcriptional regulator n=1 Tax=Desulfosporosinus sp. FKB TaxID=1969835 RepID=UPI001FA82AAC|nr:TetR/AcrR family transcriptional regulator [Desulfosporosinus sp. FKB]
MIIILYEIDKRQEIVEATAALMHSKGYENTKLSDILEAAQIGKGQFYHYFSSKHEFGLAVIDYFFDNWNRRLLEDILGSEKDPNIKFDEMLEWVVQNHISNQAKCGCVFGNLAIEMSEHDERFRLKIKAVFDTWVDKLKPVLAGMLKGSSQSEPEGIDKLAHGIVAMLEGGILMMKSQQDIKVLIDVTDLVRYLVNSFVQDHSAV